MVLIDKTGAEVEEINVLEKGFISARTRHGGARP